MTGEENYKKMLEEYDAAFDFYMDQGRLPDSISKGDLLGGFVGQTIDDNPQLAGQDPLWQELLKEELLKFIEAMLKLFKPIEENHKEEKRMIARFNNGGMDVKRQMWGQVVEVVSNQYGPEEVNLQGYLNQMKEKEDKETVVDTFVKDWDKACDKREREQKRKTLEMNARRWEQHVKDHAYTDFQERKSIEKFFFSYPQLRDIFVIMGREQPQRKDEMDDTVLKYLPLLPSPPKPASEVDEIANGRDLKHLLPIETAIMSDGHTEDLFYLKYATEQLQLFASRPKENSRFKTEQVNMKKPRLEKGPIIVAVDTSASMHGEPQKIAYAVLFQLPRMARKQKRSCYLITYSVRAKVLDLTKPGNWMRLQKFMEETFTGGTDGEMMLNTAMDMLFTKKFAMADVLIISDFYFPLPVEETQKRMEREHSKGTRFYGLRVKGENLNYDKILDKVWSIE